MKRIGSSDSSSTLITICPSSEEQSPRNNQLYGREFQSMLEGLDEEGCVEEFGHHSEKKRRLRVDQVKALEKNFEVENKLEPERKIKLAQELGLQPRQVAVWFQNRRARWKTKQLERDYGVLKANYDALKLKYDTLNKDNEALHKEIRDLKPRLEEDKSTSGVSVKKETTVGAESESDEEEEEKSNRNSTPETSVPGLVESKDDLDYDCLNNTTTTDDVGAAASFFPLELKDGSSDSDSSAILNDENSPKAAISSSGVPQSQNHLLSPESSYPGKFSCFTPSMNYFQYQKLNQVKMEEHNFLSADEACNYFSDEQAPTLQWYCPDQWN